MQFQHQHTDPFDPNQTQTDHVQNPAPQNVLSLFVIMRGLPFWTFVSRIVATAQWSLTSFANTPTDEYLWGTLVKIRSIKEDLLGDLIFGRVGLSII